MNPRSPATWCEAGGSWARSADRVDPRDRRVRVQRRGAARRSATRTSTSCRRRPTSCGSTGSVPDPAMLDADHELGADPLVLCVAQQLPHKRIERVLAAMRGAPAGAPARGAPRVRGRRPLPLLLTWLAASWPARSASESPTSSGGSPTPSSRRSTSGPTCSSRSASTRASACRSSRRWRSASRSSRPRRAAIPSTVGDAGLLIDEPDDPALSAAAIDRVVRDDHLRTTLIGRGVMRAKLVAAPASLPQMLASVLRAVPEVAPAATP